MKAMFASLFSLSSRTSDIPRIYRELGSMVNGHSFSSANTVYVRLAITTGDGTWTSVGKLKVIIALDFSFLTLTVTSLVDGKTNNRSFFPLNVMARIPSLVFISTMQ